MAQLVLDGAAKQTFTEKLPSKAKKSRRSAGEGALKAPITIVQAKMFKSEVKNKIRKFPSAQDGLRAMAEHAPHAEALAASWIEIARPAAQRLYSLRRRIATVTVAVLAGLLFVHVMFGVNGMIVYKQKRTEYDSLRQRIIQEQKENDLYTQRIQALKTDEKAIEKEAREQLRYARPGEYVYVPSEPGQTPPANHSAKN